MYGMAAVRTTYQWQMHWRYKKTSEGKLLGHCLDLPFITVHGKTPDDLLQKLYHDIDVYFTTFPEKATAFLNERATTVSQKVQVVGIEQAAAEELPAAKANWQKQELLCTVRA